MVCNIPLAGRDLAATSRRYSFFNVSSDAMILKFTAVILNDQRATVDIARVFRSSRVWLEDAGKALRTLEAWDSSIATSRNTFFWIDDFHVAAKFVEHLGDFAWRIGHTKVVDGFHRPGRLMEGPRTAPSLIPAVAKLNLGEPMDADWTETARKTDELSARRDISPSRLHHDLVVAHLQTSCFAIKLAVDVFELIELFECFAMRAVHRKYWLGHRFSPVFRQMETICRQKDELVDVIPKLSWQTEEW